MSMRCDVCGKEPKFGKRVSRLGRGAMHRRVKGRSSRLFYPNVQRVRAIVEGKPARIRACTSCIRKGKVLKRTS